MTMVVNYTENDIQKLYKLIQSSKAILIGAGAGLSTSAGFYVSGEIFHKYFFDFEKKYNLKDMYSGSFYPYKTKNEYWAFMSRNIYLNRFSKFPKNTYNLLYEIFKNKNYFVFTTNVDHCFQKSGFDKNKLYYMQGDMGLLQCKKPCHYSNYENYEIIKNMLLDQGFNFDENGELIPNKDIKMKIKNELIPKCPKCGGEMDFNLRIGNWFVEDEGWRKHEKLYEDFLNKYINGDILLIELGVGYGTPGIIKYPFWRFAKKNKNAKYVTINYGQAEEPKEISDRSLVFSEDIHKIAEKLYELSKVDKSINKDL